MGRTLFDVVSEDITYNQINQRQAEIDKQQMDKMKSMLGSTPTDANL